MSQTRLIPHSQQQQARVNALSEHIVAIIKHQGGQISFAEYMQHALYTPNLGYYSGGAVKFGKHGDFITSPEISPLFGQCLAQQSMEFIQHYTHAHLLEFGAGSGQLALDILRHLAQHHTLPERYFIVEVSADLRLRQQQKLQAFPELYAKVEWLDELPQRPMNVFIIANEVFDAMPVSRFTIKNDAILEEFVRYENHQFVPHFAEMQPGPTRQAIALLKEKYQWQQYHSEINMWYQQWFKSLRAFIKHGIILIIDYGFPEAEYYHSNRHNGTLMCHYTHLAHDDPYVLTGIQDITAHVDFSAVAHAAYKNALEVSGFSNQAAFLLSSGLPDLLQRQQLDEKQRLMQNHAIKLLTHPCEMGELFKVIAINKDVPFALSGFQLQDKQHLLT